MESENNPKLFPTVGAIAIHMSECIKNRRLDLKPIKYFTRMDGMSKKKELWEYKSLCIRCLIM